MRKEEYKLTAPDVSRLVHCYSHAVQNPEQPSAALMEILDGKLLVSLIIGREVAKHIGGFAVAYYE